MVTPCPHRAVTHSKTHHLLHEPDATCWPAPGARTRLDLLAGRPTTRHRILLGIGTVTREHLQAPGLHLTSPHLTSHTSYEEHMHLGPLLDTPSSTPHWNSPGYRLTANDAHVHHSQMRVASSLFFGKMTHKALFFTLQFYSNRTVPPPPAAPPSPTLP